MPRSIALGVVLALCASVAGACGNGSLSRDGDSQTDARPLAERLTAANESPESVSPPWFRGAVEASPATNFTLDGEKVDRPDLFVVGEVIAVEGATGFSTEGPMTADDLVEFNSSDSVRDIVFVTLQVDNGVAENGGPLPDRVRFALGLPAPTDLPSLQRELSGRFGAILFRIQYLDSTLADRLDTDLYDVLDHFLGRVRGDEVIFGEFYPPNEFLPDETVPITDIIAGAGDIEMVTKNGEPTRAD